MFVALLAGLTCLPVVAGDELTDDAGLGLLDLPEGAGDGKEERAMWKEWVDAFAKAEEIAFVCPRSASGVTSYVVNDPKVLKSISAEVGECLDASEREEWEGWMEMRIKGFSPKMKGGSLWVSTDERPQPGGFTGQMFVLEYGNGGSATIGIEKGKKLPVLSGAICAAGRAFGMRLFESKVPKSGD